MNNLKLKFALAMVALAAFTTSCGDDDGARASIVGKWDYTRTITEVEGQNPVSQNYAGHEPGCEKDYQEFLADGSYRDVALFQDQNDQCNEFADEGNYAQSGDQITIQEDGGIAQTYTITKLTGGELRYSSTAQTGGVEITVTQVFRKK
ncbi:lipocalin-like domain-containing protein [Flavobacterium selenitireducens]|uniref:lipocalin family protein n=1 Tax=Flavobacterium selenitireducens TaxID=2722704 RepID=UPI00168B6F6B|nr:lipocalin family protein [Flavobacterium selenitireducens]MBD3582918.1 lipocalin family protein [Flavobacterium selenitireducens]